MKTSIAYRMTEPPNNSVAVKWVKQLAENHKTLLLGMLVAGLLTASASGVTIDFKEGAEGRNVSINYSSGDWWVVSPPTTSVGSESASFSGYLPPGGNLGTGSYVVGLQESPGGPPSDWVQVSWNSVLYLGTFYLTQFSFTFKSDIEGQILLPPSGDHTIALETGDLQRFQIPSTAFNLNVGIQSDLESTHVPDTGTSLGMLSVAVIGLASVKRSLVARGRRIFGKLRILLFARSKGVIESLLALTIRSGLRLSACLVFSAAMAANAGLILNGSFESPLQSSTGFHFTTPDSWSGGALLYNGPASGIWPAPEDGQQYDDIGLSFSPVLSQIFNVPSAGSYTLTWYDNAALFNSSSYNVIINGSMVGSYNISGSSVWSARSITLSLNAGDNTLSFDSTGANADSLIDNVSLGESVVPEPTTLLAGALLLLPLALQSARRFCRST